MVKNLAESYPRVSRQIELKCDELGYVAEGIPKQNVEGVTWFLPAAYNKMLKERDISRKNCQTKRDQHLL